MWLNYDLLNQIFQFEKNVLTTDYHARLSKYPPQLRTAPTTMSLVVKPLRLRILLLSIKKISIWSQAPTSTRITILRSSFLWFWMWKNYLFAAVQLLCIFGILKASIPKPLISLHWDHSHGFRISFQRQLIVTAIYIPPTRNQYRIE